MTKLCMCGCGEATKMRKGKFNDYIRGHWTRTGAAKEMLARRRIREVVPINPSGLCFCGCGETTTLAPKTDTRKGWIAGEHVGFLPGHVARTQRGDNAPRWNGGRAMTTNGYVRIHMPNHPDAQGDGYIAEHRLVAEATIGRRLTKKEVVHHINGVRDDNRAENLVVMTGQGEHTRHHQALRDAAAD